MKPEDCPHASEVFQIGDGRVKIRCARLEAELPAGERFALSQKLCESCIAGAWAKKPVLTEARMLARYKRILRSKIIAGDAPMWALAPIRNLHELMHKYEAIATREDVEGLFGKAVRYWAERTNHPITVIEQKAGAMAEEFSLQSVLAEIESEPHEQPR